MKIRIFLVVLLLVLLAPVRAEMNWESMTIKATSTAPADAGDLLQRELIGLMYDANTTVGQFLSANFDRGARLTGVLNEYRTVRQNYLTDGSIEYQYQLPLLPKILALLLPNRTPVRLVVPMLCPVCGQEWPNDRPVPEGLELVPKELETGEFTGVVIDCRGLSLQPCLFPKVLNDQNQEVFSFNFADPVAVTDNGLVLYCPQEPFNHPRIGYNPLRIHALAVTGPGSTDIRISAFDARRLHGSRQILSLLDECRIAIIIGP